MRRLFIIAILALLVLLPLAAQAPTPAAAQSGNTWTANYFNNPNWSGNPVLVQFVPFVSFNWGFGSPGAGVPVDNFTARFDTSAFFYAGAYTFTTQADDEVALIVDGVTLIDTRGAGQSGKTQTVTWSMWQGNHQVHGVLPRVYADGLRQRQLVVPEAGWRYPAARAANPSASPVGELQPDVGHQRTDPIRQLHTLHSAEHPPGQLLCVGWPMELPEYWLDPNRAADPNLEGLHAG